MSNYTHQQLARISELDAAIDSAADQGDDVFFAAVAAKDEYIDSQGIDRNRLEVTGREVDGHMQKYASGEWNHLFSVGGKETRCRIVIDLEQSKLIAAQEWTGLKFECVRGDRLKDLAESVIEVNEAHINLYDWNSELSKEMPEWAGQRKVLGGLRSN